MIRTTNEPMLALDLILRKKYFHSGFLQVDILFRAPNFGVQSFSKAASYLDILTAGVLRNDQF